MRSKFRALMRTTFPSLFGGTKDSPAKHSRRTDRQSRTKRPGLEVLEGRTMLVVDAVGRFPLIVGPSTGFDGVVQVFSPGGFCSGTLIADGVETGRHILTAAHCVDNDVDTTSPPDGTPDRGNGTVDAGTHRVRFDMPGGPITLSVPAANITVHNQWNGFANQGSDIALIRLPELAPFGAEKRFPYRDTDEMADQGENFQFLGYGRTNRTNTAIDGTCPGPVGTICSGNFGHSGSDPAGLPTGTKRMGFNRLDGVTTFPAGSGSAFDQYLSFDMDDPNSTTDSGTFGEALSAPGDSGGPLLISSLIAGVASTGRYLTPPAYGGTANYTRVSSFAGWIDQITAARYSLVLDMNNQLAGNDGSADRIELRTQNQFVQILVNEQLYHSDLATKIQGITIRGSNDSETITITSTIQRSLTVNSGSGFDTINIESLPRGMNASINTGADRDIVNFSPTLRDLNNIQSSVVINGGPIFFEDDINFYDFNNSSRNRSYVLDQTSLKLPGSAATVSFTNIAAIFVGAGSADDSTVNVWGTPAGSATTIQDAAVVNFGKPQPFPFIGKSTGDVRGAVSLTSLFRGVALTIDDTADALASTVDITRNAVQGLSDLPIDFTFARLSSLTINAGTGGNTVTVQDTRASDLTGPITLKTGSGADTVNIQQVNTFVLVNGQRGLDTVNFGLNGNMQGIAAPVQVLNTGAWSTLNLDDSANTLPRAVSLDAIGTFGTISGLAPAVISYRKQDLAALNVSGGSGNNVFDILNTAQSTIAGGSPTTLLAGNGLFDAINVLGTTGPLFVDPQSNFNQITIGGQSGPGGSLNRIRGDVTLRGQDGVRGNFVDIIDRASTGRYIYTMDAQRLFRTNPTGGAPTGNISYGDLPLDGLEIFGANRGNVFQINGTPLADESVVGGGVHVATGDGNDSATVLGASAGRLNVLLGAGANQSITIGDATHSLDAVQGAVHVSGNGFIDASISDEASTTPKLTTIDYNAADGQIVERYVSHLVDSAKTKLNTFRFAFPGQAHITYQAGRTGIAGIYNQIDVHGVPANTDVVVSGGPDYDVFTVGFAADASRILGPVTIHSAQADIDFAYFYDYLNPNRQTYTVRTNPLDSTGVLVERAGLPTVTYNGLTQLVYYSPLVGGNITNVQSGPANLYLNMQVGEGDTITLGSSAPALGGTLDGIAGPAAFSSYGLDDVVTLIVDDSGNTTTARDVAIGPHEPGQFGLITGLTGSSLLFRDYENYVVDIRGGALNDRFVMSGNPLNANISIDGGAGNDVLIGSGGNVLRGGAGRDLLIAGVLASILEGGADEDILIGGTLRDNRPTVLDAIMAEWSRADGYDARVANLRSGLLSVDNVVGNGDGNTLTGGGDALDLFFGSLVTDLQEGEVLVPL